MTLRLAIYSDLHLEFGDWHPPRLPAVDAVILAGDIHLGTRGIIWAQETFTGIPVYYVAGNHEYYGQDWAALPSQLLQAAVGSNVTVLENSEHVQTCKGQKVHILGASLWTDFGAAGDSADAMRVAPIRMNDYVHISHNGGPLEPDAVRRRHMRSVARLHESLEAIPNTETTIVVTHHAPSLLSLPEAREPVAPYYASRLDSLIRARQPDLWIHGHTHGQCDYRIAHTRIVSNQRGYANVSPDTLVNDFVDDLMIEVPIREHRN